MLEDKALIKVTNISRGKAGYELPELSVRRSFTRGETKNIPFAELRALSYMNGGMKLLKDHLSIKNEDALVELGIQAEPEYFWTEVEVKELLLNGSVERLQDCLDYAPKGIVDLVKELAVSLKINDLSKRDAIFKATGFNVNSAISFNEDDEEVETPEPKQRRVPVEADASAEVPHIKTNYRRVTE